MFHPQMEASVLFCESPKRKPETLLRVWQVSESDALVSAPSFGKNRRREKTTERHVSFLDSPTINAQIKKKAEWNIMIVL